MHFQLNSSDLSYSNSKMREWAPGLPTVRWHGDVLTEERFLPNVVAKFYVNLEADLSVPISKSWCACRQKIKKIDYVYKIQKAFMTLFLKVLNSEYL